MSEARVPVVPRTVKGLGLVSLFNDFASEMVYPLLPAFVTRGLGAGALALGALDGAAELTSAAIKWVSGRLADRPGWRKPLILAGYGTAVLVRPLIAVASAAWQVIGFRVLDRVGKGLRSPARDALIAQITPPAARGRAFGFHRAADHLGAVAGSLVAWLLLSAAVDVRDVIAYSAIPGLVVMLVLSVVLRGVDRPAAAREATGSGPPATGAFDARGAAFWFPVLCLVLLAAGRLPETLLILRLQDVGVPVATIPLVWGALHVVRTGAAYPGGWLSDRIGTRSTLSFAGLLFAAVLALLAQPVGPAAATAIFLGLGLVSGLGEAAERAAVAALAPVRTGTGFGSFQGLAGLAALPAALAFGGLYQAVSGPAALVTSAVAMVVGVTLWWIAAGRSGP